MNAYTDLTDETAAEGATVALADARLGASGHFFEVVREMDSDWDDDALRNHVASMQRRAVVHDDPACMETAYVAEAILSERERNRDAALITGGAGNVLRPTAVSVNDHGILWTAGRFSAEASSLPRPGRVYADACDTGYTLHNPATGRSVIVAASHVERDREGDVAYTDYAPIRRSDPQFILRVWND